MNRISKLSLTIILIFSLVTIGSALAGDLDDGIEIDESIESLDTLGKPDPNVQYLIRSAKAKAQQDRNGVYRYDDDSDSTVIGGIINEPGTDTGDITIIFEGDDITAVTQ